MNNTNDLPKSLKWTMTFIDRLGFPIVVCGFLAWFLLFKMEDYQKEARENKKVIVDAIQANTTAIYSLTEAVRGNRRPH